MLVTIEALCCIIFLEAVAFEISEKRWLDWDLILTNYKSLAFAHRLVCLVPRMLFDLSCCEALIGVGLKYFIDEVDAVG